MKNSTLNISALLIFFLTHFIGAQDIESEVDKLYQVGDNEPGFSIAIFKGDKIELEKQYGIANLAYDIPITEKTIFDIGSIAKQFTAAAILLLEAEGKLSIKDPAYKYIENLPRYQRGDPTIEQLLNQTSGIKEVDPFLELADIAWRDYIRPTMLLNIITHITELRFTPGEYFYYTNSNYLLLAAIIEQASGMTYEEYLQESIFKPLQMENTLVNTNIYRVIKNRAIGYMLDDGIAYQTHQPSLFYAGDGQIITNPSDMFKWHQNLRKATIGSEALWKKMHTKARLNDGTVINHGLGVEFETHNGFEAYGFDGMIKSGFVSKYLHFPELGYGFFTTQNTFDWDFTDRFFQLIDLYIPKGEEASEGSNFKEIEIAKSDLKKYEGQYLYYYNDDERKANSIKVKGKELHLLTLDGDKIARLIPIGNKQFLFGEDESALVTFNLEGNRKQYTYDEFENEVPWLFQEFTPYQHSKKELEEYEGQYFNESLQVSKKIKLEDDKLYFYYRNGAWKDEMESLSKDLLEIPSIPIEFIRNGKDQITGFNLMGLVFRKL